MILHTTLLITKRGDYLLIIIRISVVELLIVQTIYITEMLISTHARILAHVRRIQFRSGLQFRI